MVKILTSLSLLMPTFSLPVPPPFLPEQLQRDGIAPLPNVSVSVASVSDLSPVYFRRARTRPVSCYALFKCVAASEPTSWLSSR